MKSKPLSNKHASRGHPTQEGACRAPGEDFAGRLTDEAQRCARKLLASPCQPERGQGLWLN